MITIYFIKNKLRNRKIKVITHDGFCYLFPPSPNILMCQAMVVSCLLLVFLLSSFLVLHTPFLHTPFLCLEILSITTKAVTVAFEKCLTRSHCKPLILSDLFPTYFFTLHSSHVTCCCLDTLSIFPLKIFARAVPSA